MVVRSAGWTPPAGCHVNGLILRRKMMDKPSTAIGYYCPSSKADVVRTSDKRSTLAMAAKKVDIFPRQIEYTG